MHGNRHLLPPRLRSIECMARACVFVKCYDDDVRCDQYLPQILMTQGQLAAWEPPSSTTRADPLVDQVVQVP
jgi:hypothetical protein